ncbi:MAG: translation initiation factor IF-2 [Candidatus Methanomethylicota archaeon]|nr:MAG: translation initiation factor IF-2 [Candidatus Verstraetearchaeota archaeon]
MSDRRRIRQPIVCVLGHVDVGKTALLDKIRGTAVMLKEPGTMTQHIGASFIPWSTLKEICGQLLKAVKADIEIPGLLFIDTPGHEAFVNLRRRGGSIADIAILVIDVTEGFENQTYESVEILRARKTPFLVAANKIDKIPGWKPFENASFLESSRRQSEWVVNRLDELISNIIYEFYRLGFRADRFDRIKDFAKTVAIVPTSAKTGEGIPELLMVLAGLTQRFMTERLKFTSGPAKGVVLEVREEPGLGTTIDVIIYDGVIRRGDLIVVGGLEKPIVTRVRALLLPKPLDEMRSPEDRFMNVEEVAAAAGVKVVAPNLDGAVAGAPIIVVDDVKKIGEVQSSVAEEVSVLRISRKVSGVVLKTDTLGSLEALTSYLERLGIPVRIADVGPVSKRDVIEAAIVRDSDLYRGVILAFNVKVLPDAEEEAKSRGIKIFRDVIIYRLVEAYQKWYHENVTRDRMRKFEELIKPGKIRIMPGCVFRRSDPAIVGVEVKVGRIRPGYQLMRSDGRVIGEILQIQDKGKTIKEAAAGQSIAISIKGNIIVGRHIKEGDVLYVNVPESHARVLASEFKDSLSDEELELLKEIGKIRRRSGRV